MVIEIINTCDYYNYLMIDLRSDTVTEPTEEMRKASASAEVGDDARGEDPTVDALETRAAEIFGKEDAIFVPSGTMGNQIAIRTHTKRGNEILCEKRSHIFERELGAGSQLSGVQTKHIDGGQTGIPEPHAIDEAIVSAGKNRPKTGLICIENPHNSRGGKVIPKEKLDEISKIAKNQSIPLHLDGSRIFNAAIALEMDVEKLTENVDTIMVCLSKGLGAPIGSLLVGNQGFINRSKKVRQLFGGCMRQAGIIAAPGLMGLKNRSKLSKDHENAKKLAEGLANIDGIVPSEPDTNIIHMRIKYELQAFIDYCENNGILCTPMDEGRVRMCTHYDVSEKDIQRTIKIIDDIELNQKYD